MRGMGGVMADPMRGMGGMRNEPMDGKIARFKKEWRAPFTLSGSFSDEDFDGWTGGGALITSGARTAPGCLAIASNLNAYQNLFIPAALARNRRFTISVWHKHVNGSGVSTSRAIRYKIGGFSANQQHLNGVQDEVTSWRQLVGVLDNPENKDVVLSVFGACNGGNFQVWFDDWSIEGVPLERISA